MLLKKPKFQILASSDQQFSHYATPIFDDFAKNGRYSQFLSDYISATSGPNLLVLVYLER